MGKFESTKLLLSIFIFFIDLIIGFSEVNWLTVPEKTRKSFFSILEENREERMSSHLMKINNLGIYPLRIEGVTDLARLNLVLIPGE